jgi:hypothetical protein
MKTAGVVFSLAVSAHGAANKGTVKFGNDGTTAIEATANMLQMSARTCVDQSNFCPPYKLQEYLVPGDINSNHCEQVYFRIQWQESLRLSVR